MSKSFTCQVCKVRYWNAYSHPTLGPVCPICLRPVQGRTRQSAEPKRREPETRRFSADHPGQPLGRGYPSGSTLRLDGESHRQAWLRIIRADPCAYCGGPGGTVDHVVPRSRGLPGTYDWSNVVGACQTCNENKADSDLLLYLRGRASGQRCTIPELIVRRAA